MPEVSLFHLSMHLLAFCLLLVPYAERSGEAGRVYLRSIADAIPSGKTHRTTVDRPPLYIIFDMNMSRNDIGQRSILHSMLCKERENKR